MTNHTVKFPVTDSHITLTQVAFLSACFLQLPLSSVKISVLLFYKRIFSISQKLAVCTWVAIGVIVAWCAIFTVVSIPGPLGHEDECRPQHEW